MNEQLMGVLRTLIAAGAIWKYLDTGTNLGTAWLAPGFDDTAWASGPAELGYGDIPDGAGGTVTWGPALWRVDLAPSYRFSPHTELKLQFSLQHGGGPRRQRGRARQHLRRAHRVPEARQLRAQHREALALGEVLARLEVDETALVVERELEALHAWLVGGRGFTEINAGIDPHRRHRSGSREVESSSHGTSRAPATAMSTAKMAALPRAITITSRGMSNVSTDSPRANECGGIRIKFGTMVLHLSNHDPP